MVRVIRMVHRGSGHATHVRHISSEIGRSRDTVHGNSASRRAPSTRTGAPASSPCSCIRRRSGRSATSTPPIRRQTRRRPPTAPPATPATSTVAVMLASAGLLTDEPTAVAYGGVLTALPMLLRDRSRRTTPCHTPPPGMVGRPSARAAARLACRFPSFIGAITPSRDSCSSVARSAATKRWCSSPSKRSEPNAPMIADPATPPPRPTGPGHPG